MSYLWLFFHYVQDESADYQLTAFANVSFNETAEETMDSMQEPDQDTVSAYFGLVELAPDWPS